MLSKNVFQISGIIRLTYFLCFFKKLLGFVDFFVLHKNHNFGNSDLKFCIYKRL